MGGLRGVVEGSRPEIACYCGRGLKEMASPHRVFGMIILCIWTWQASKMVNLHCATKCETTWNISSSLRVETVGGRENRLAKVANHEFAYSRICDYRTNRHNLP